MHDPIAYTYNADTHCPPCAEARWGRCSDGFIACSDDHPVNPYATDNEGNTIGVMFSWDEWCEPTEFGLQTLACGTCLGEIDTCDHGDPPMYEDNDPEDYEFLKVPPASGIPSWLVREHSDGARFMASDATHNDYEAYITDPSEDEPTGLQSLAQLEADYNRLHPLSDNDYEDYILDPCEDYPACEDSVLTDPVEWLTPTTPRPPYCWRCAEDGHTYRNCPDHDLGGSD